MATDCCPESMSQSLRRMVLGIGRICGTSGARKATLLVPQADPFIVHQLAARAPFVSSVRAV